MPAGRPANPVKKIFREIKKAKNFLETSLSHTDPRTRIGIETRQRSCVDKIEALRLEYKKLLRDNAFVILLTGNRDYQNRFATIASEYDCYVGEIDLLYRSITKTILPSVRIGTIFTVDQVLMIDEALIDVRSKLGIGSMPHPSMTSEFCRPISNFDTLMSLVQASIERAVDVNLAIKYLEDALTDLAYQHEYSERILPVVAVGADANAVAKCRELLFKTDDGNRVFTVHVGPNETPGADLVVSEIDDQSVVAAVTAAAKHFGYKINKLSNETTQETKSDANGSENQEQVKGD